MSILYEISESIAQLKTEGRDVCQIVLSPETTGAVLREMMEAEPALSMPLYCFTGDGRDTLFGIPFRVGSTEDIQGKPWAYTLVS